MKTIPDNETHGEAVHNREKLLADLPIKEDQILAGGIQTAYL